MRSLGIKVSACATTWCHAIAQYASDGDLEAPGNWFDFWKLRYMIGLFSSLTNENGKIGFTFWPRICDMKAEFMRRCDMGASLSNRSHMPKRGAANISNH